LDSWSQRDFQSGKVAGEEEVAAEKGTTVWRKVPLRRRNPEKIKDECHREVGMKKI
jgi:hypothetical protein